MAQTLKMYEETKCNFDSFCFIFFKVDNIRASKAAEHDWQDEDDIAWQMNAMCDTVCLGIWDKIGLQDVCSWWETLRRIHIAFTVTRKLWETPLTPFQVTSNTIITHNYIRLCMYTLTDDQTPPLRYNYHIVQQKCVIRKLLQHDNANKLRHSQK